MSSFSRADLGDFLFVFPPLPLLYNGNNCRRGGEEASLSFHCPWHLEYGYVFQVYQDVAVNGSACMDMGGGALNHFNCVWVSSDRPAWGPPRDTHRPSGRPKVSKWPSKWPSKSVLSTLLSWVDKASSRCFQKSSKQSSAVILA